MEAFRIVTWNTDGLNESRLGQRMEQLCLEMLIGGDLAAAMAGRATPPMPDVIALQEVVQVAHRGYFAPHLSAAGYSIGPDRPPTDSEYYELIAAGPRWAIERCERRPFDQSPLGRACIFAVLRHRESGERLTVATAHLESLRSGREARLAQVRQLDAWLAEGGESAVFAGDTNLRDGEWNILRRHVAFADAFEVLGSPPSARVTWRPEEGQGGFRFDRIWLSGALRAETIRTRPGGAMSDHDGVEAVVARTD